MEPYYRLWQSSNDKQWYFALVAGNGEVVAQSEGYMKKQSAKKGIAAVKKSLFAKVVET